MLFSSLLLAGLASGADDGRATAGDPVDLATGINIPRLHPGIASSQCMRRPDASQDSAAGRRPASSR